MRGVNITYFARRIGMFFLVIFVAASFNFIIPRLAPGNPYRCHYFAHGQR